MKKVCTVYAPDDSISEFCDDQLREWVGYAVWYSDPSNQRWYLAEELLAKRQENKRLRASLKRLLLEYDFMMEAGLIPDTRDDIIFVEARAALEGEE